MLANDILRNTFGDAPKVNHLKNCSLETRDMKQFVISDVLYFTTVQKIDLYEKMEQNWRKCIRGTLLISGYFISSDFDNLEYYYADYSEIIGFNGTRKQKIVGVSLEKNRSVLPLCYHKFQAIKILDI